MAVIYVCVCLKAQTELARVKVEMSDKQKAVSGGREVYTIAKNHDSLEIHPFFPFSFSRSDFFGIIYSTFRGNALCRNRVRYTQATMTMVNVKIRIVEGKGRTDGKQIELATTPKM